MFRGWQTSAHELEDAPSENLGKIVHPTVEPVVQMCRRTALERLASAKYPIQKMPLCIRQLFWLNCLLISTM